MYTDKMDAEQNKNFIDNKINMKIERRGSHRLNNVGIISGIINMVLMISLLTILFVKQEKSETQRQENDLSSRQTSSDMKRGRDMMCIPCEFLGDEVAVNDTLYDVIVTTEHDHKMCCLYKEHELQRFIMQMIQQESDGVFKQIDKGSTHSSEDLKWWRGRTSSAHLYHDKEAGKEFIPSWTVDGSRNTSFVNDLVFENNSIHVTREDDNGVYFVYSAVTLDVESEKSLPSGFHKIVKRNKVVKTKGEPTPYILQMSKYGGSPMTSQVYTNFLCGTIRLQQHEFVQSVVAENSYKYMDKRKHASFFGLYKL